MSQLRRSKEVAAVREARERKRAHVAACDVCRAAETGRGLYCLLGMQLHREIGRQQRLDAAISRTR